MSLRSKPLQYRHFNVTFPEEWIVQVTLNRPEKLNCIDTATSVEIQEIWELFDQDESLWVGIITGAGRAFCTGADLEEWNEMNKAGVINNMAAPGLAGLPRRAGKKPIIAAVNAARAAIFSLPEVKRGIVPVAGCLPRLTRTLGLQRTTDLVLTGRNVDAETLYNWGLVTRLVDSTEEVVHAAVQVAQEMCRNSPDALIVGRLGIRLSWEAGNVEEAVSTLTEQWYPRLIAGPNFGEGIKAFVQKRHPVWTNSKL
ncbi:hypothetical protein H2203_001017 [Taxawa tesnikishii (nom. ined.)]|nr:hypothetical protein H2203_001017 [Dothideales sp. JES 119]